MNGRLIVSVIKKSLSSLHELSRVVFRVNPDDLDTVLKAFPDYEAVSDPAITQGGLKIDTSIGEMDYTIETMLENFKKLIYEELEST
jgi:flagellar assembly protein FliH